MAVTNVTIVGAGVVGLTTAFILSHRRDLSITLIAKHMPGDYDIEYASPWAGANYWPVGAPGTLLQRLEKATWADLDRICREHPEAGIHYQDSRIYGREKDADSTTGKWMDELGRRDPWFAGVLPNFRVLEPSEVPKGYDWGTTFTSVCINTPVYLSWLLGQAVKNGVVVKRGVLTHISDAAQLHHSGASDITINCTGLLAAKLGGVMDANVFPGRGQVTLVRNEPDAMVTTSGTDDGGSEAAYVMQRAVGGGTILGGCMQHGEWESQPDLNLAARIMQRAVDLVPSLVPKTGKVTELSVIRHGVGLRPMRKGGVRVERERIDGGWVLHAYGHAGYGYQSSFGTAREVERLLEGVLGEKARL
ncbi:FAD dependent oxidoreductase [Aaosphaeria arxii CBS 175.79]|uniref:FAD dependent oxidoreductase n=1 Tax=Aaosphaeria arxii CBS 175.79 TaxID=1450172 RepID=A0A6A5Y3V1_9PLEO|nr:FAD dependent oxidoreductase [Aaosphaeria arxii CBS 175.79]KAF2019936.1 FAD dependent oxidoreductase [Aaosphaeria arxii CBS 175.79]